MDEVSGFRIALYGFLIVIGAWATWWAKIRALTIPRNPIVYQCAVALGGVLALWGLLRGSGPLGNALAVLALVGSVFFLVTAAMRRLPDAPAAAVVGAPFLEFSTLDEDGNQFALSSMAGRPFLLKFFRGHW
jgi:hypothetical protein